MVNDPTWLDEIKEGIQDSRERHMYVGQYADFQRMDRVLRELSKKLEACMNITGVVPNLSDDAKELLK